MEKSRLDVRIQPLLIAKFIFLAAMNPCPCGYKGAREKYCTCTEKQVEAYQNRVFGPIFGQIDILASLEPVNLEGVNFLAIETLETIRNRVIKTRMRHYELYGCEVTNSSVPFEELVNKSMLTKEQHRKI